MSKCPINNSILKVILILLVLAFCLSKVYSQEELKVVDSLKKELNKLNALPENITNDTIKLNILEALIENIYEDEVWGKYNAEYIRISKKLLENEDKKIKRKAQLSLALGLNDEGLLESNRGNFKIAEQLYFNSLNILKILNEQENVAMALNNIGYNFKAQGNLVKALDYYLQSLKIRETINDESGIAMSLNNIGLIYDAQGNQKLAKEYFLKCIEILEKHGDRYQISSTLNNLGHIYLRELYFNKAIELFIRSKILQQSIGDKNGEAYTYINLGTVYLSMKKYDESTNYFKKGLNIFTSIGLNEGLAWTYINLGQIHLLLKNYKESNRYLDSASFFAYKINQPELIQRTEFFNYQLDSTLGKYNGAFEHYKKYIFYRDNITNNETEKKNVQLQLNYEFEKKEAVLKAQQHKDKLITEEKSRKQQFIIWITVITLVLVFSLSVFILRTLNLTKKQKAIIEKQKDFAEQKQKETLDSIYYAKRIQNCMLPNEKHLQKKINELKTPHT
ncbi:MAG: tetratricopeptide repeat protein [Bacteroidetes bacterium]|nr:Photosystem I assembly protein Ycf3 [Flavobacteriales bacterium]MCL4816508.1 tetratricopeptide repeat protein [Flavobacteriales bacterium]NOG94396.1 tetratricopeptide repeat protein [Bacteroidota bacterium]WKZ75240.1 MAG: tetratricopeptide repeat protein [Vicingaceae bacterium]